MQKKAQFFIDDVLWCLRDVTRKKPQSLFDHPFFGALKKAHDQYGLKVQLNLFYRTSFWYGNDEFSLSDMTDIYKSEFEASADWLKFGFHSKEEWPDYPYVNADYDLVDNNFKLIKNEVLRFAGEKSFANCVIPHWAPISKEGIMALKDNGVKVTYATYGVREEWDPENNTLPYGHSMRLLHNKKSESGIYKKVTRDFDVINSLCSYNHVSEDVYMSRVGKLDIIKDEETGMCYTTLAQVVLNLVPMEILKDELSKFTHFEYLSVADHEQYFYPEYFAYQSDYAEKIFVAGQTLKDAGYTFIFAEELAK